MTAALAAADCGISVAEAHSAAAQTAAVVVTSGGLTRVADAIGLSRGIGRIARQNLALALVYSGLMLPAAVFGAIGPAFAAAAMLASSVSVVLNSQRLTGRPSGHSSSPGFDRPPDILPPARYNPENRGNFMSRISRRTLTFLPFLLLAACGAPETRFKSYDGPPVTRIVVNKGERRMYLMSGGTVLKAYDVGLGNEPVGTKRFEGDGKTPEGVYFIDRVNPDSAYHLSLGVSYPNIRDTAHVQSQGRDPGGDIFIHGWGPKATALRRAIATGPPAASRSGTTRSRRSMRW